MVDHDQLFKTLLRTFFKEFFELFFPEWAGRFDFGQVEWQDKELFVDPPAGATRHLDLLARLPVRQPVTTSDANWLALIHVEVESADSVAPLRRRMFAYYEHLRRHFDLPVLPLGLYVRVGLDGVGWDMHQETFWDHVLVQFHYPYVGLSALNGEDYVNRDNWLGVALAVLMRVPKERRLELSQHALRRLAKCPLNDYQRLLLAGCVATYAPLSPAEYLELEYAMANATDPGERAMGMGLIEKWWNEGLQKGRRDLLVELLEGRFGTLSTPIRSRVEALSNDELKAVTKAFQTAKSLADLGLEAQPVSTT